MFRCVCLTLFARSQSQLCSTECSQMNGGTVTPEHDVKLDIRGSCKEVTAMVSLHGLLLPLAPLME